MMRALRVGAGVLVVPLALLLFFQWPLREWVQGASSRFANDLAQILFALYMAVAVVAASRAGAHLTVHLQPDGALRSGRWRRWATMACVAPWALFSLWAGWGTIRLSMAGLERFSETQNPGYFMVKLSLGVLLLLIFLESVLATRRAESPPP
jgi:TRAP-type C4-dicarboxylate transport system permease small subunit